MADKSPNSEQAIVPVTTAFGGKAYEQVKVTGNRLDNLTETYTQQRQILSYQSRWSANAADVVLWVSAASVLVRMVVLTVRSGLVSPVYPVGGLLLVLIPFAFISLDTVRRFPPLLTAFILRVLYVIFGVLVALL